MHKEGAVGSEVMTRMRPDSRLYDSSLTRRQPIQTHQWAPSPFFVLTWRPRLGHTWSPTRHHAVAKNLPGVEVALAARLSGARAGQIRRRRRLAEALNVLLPTLREASCRRRFYARASWLPVKRS